MDLFKQLEYRGMVKDVSDIELAKKLLNEEKIKFYVGYDPTGISLTVGHLVQIVRMLYLQKHGHTPVVVIGGGTGLIGDPRETSERSLLTLEKSLENADKIEAQIRTLIDGDVEFINNYEWLSKIDLISFLRDYGKHFSVSYMIHKDTVQKRLESGISYTEFSYMILQSIDWLHLYQNHNVKIQFGGSDQWGNLTSGLELIRRVLGPNDAVALSSPLLLKSDGTKFGKSESGALWLDKELTSPYELYQYFLNGSDADIETFLKLLTLKEQVEIEAILEKHKIQPELRYAQRQIAEAVVTLVHGEKACQTAIKVTEALFSGEFDDMTIEAYQTLERVLNVVEVKDETFIEVIVNSGLAQSNREVREFVNSGAISINGVKIQTLDFDLQHVEKAFGSYSILRRGKKKYALVVFK